VTVTCRVLVVEDNPATLKMLRATLEAEGCSVETAPDARTALDAAARGLPDLVLQDLILPDMDGFELVRHLRALPGGAQLPIIALSGFLGRLEEARTADAGFTALLVKPIPPSQLLESIRPYLPIPPRSAVLVGDGRRLLVVDENAVQLKLARIHGSRLGFVVSTASSVREALKGAAETRPDVVLCDVFMADADGFEFCLLLRADPTLAGIPVVLVSAHYGTDADHDLARGVGASALIARTPHFEDAAAALLAALRTGAPPAAPGGSEHITLQHAKQVIKQLERQLAISSGVARQNAHQAAQLALLSGVADALTLNADTDVALRDVLAATLDAAGISKGVLFLRNPDGTPCVRQAIGFSADERAELDGFFGRASLLEEIMERGSVVSIPSSALPEDVSREVLSALRVTSAQIVPLVTDGRSAGAMMVGATHSDMTTENSIAFARAMCNQLIQSLELTKSVARLTASEARYRALLDSATDAIAILTPEGVIREANHRWEVILGLSRAELIGRRLGDFAVPVKALEHEQPYDPAVAVHPGRRPLSEIAGADGSTVLMEFSDTTVGFGNERVVFTVGHDVTEQRFLERQLRLSQKLEAVGRLAGGVAHDFNNVLTAIIGFCELLTGDPALGDGQRRDVSEIRKAADRATRLTQQLLAFSRQQILQPKVLDMNAMIADLSPMLRRLVFESIDFLVSPRPATGLIKIDPTQFEQILVNLIVNARDAMNQGGKLTIETADVTLDGAYRQRHLQVVAGDYVMLAVSDTGVGIDDETRHRIFEPFFTTKGPGKGTGLGLATVYGIVKQSGGYIWVYSEPGRGTTFKIYFPSIRHGVASAKALTGDKVDLAGGWETIFVVEDDEGLRRLALRALARRGYQLLEAGNPREAVQTASQYPGPIHLLLSDVVMPESEGEPLIDRLTAVRPGLRVLYMSGYTDDAIVHQGILKEGTPFLQKPFTPQALARKVRDVLDAPSPAV
jgi:two-component system cell cycle sensor histidine kinase/response regulator CckA